MTQQNKIQMFEVRKVRPLWDDEQEKWYISVIDAIEILTDSNEPKRYWSDLKRKLKKEGNEPYENIVRLKMRDNMTNAELVLNMLAELSTKGISEATDPQTMTQHADVAKQGGEVALNARMELETKTGKKVVTSLNASSIQKNLGE